MPANEARHRIAARWRLCKIRTDTGGPLAVRLSVSQHPFLND